MFGKIVIDERNNFLYSLVHDLRSPFATGIARASEETAVFIAKPDEASTLPSELFGNL